MKVKFIIDTKPVPKERPRFGKGGRVFTPQTTLAFENTCALAYGNRHNFGKDPISIKIIFNFEVPKSYTKKKCLEALNGIVRPGRNDIDNLIKSVLDGLNGIAWEDDRYIAKLQAEKRYNTKDFIEVEIENIN